MDTDQELRARMYDAFARWHGHDPSKGPWILMVNPDGTSTIEVLEKPEDCWCCLDPERAKAFRQRFREAYEAGYESKFDRPITLEFDLEDRSTWWDGEYGD